MGIDIGVMARVHNRDLFTPASIYNMHRFHGQVNIRRLLFAASLSPIQFPQRALNRHGLLLVRRLILHHRAHRLVARPERRHPPRSIIHAARRAVKPRRLCRENRVIDVQRAFPPPSALVASQHERNVLAAIHIFLVQNFHAVLQ